MMIPITPRSILFMGGALTLFLFLTLPSIASADELILKDGKSVKWSSLKDLGESFEVETTDGVKLEIKKADVARIEFRARTAEASDSAKADAALTGATFSFDKKVKLVQYDLLKSLDPKAGEGAGADWKVNKGVLQADGSKMGGGTARLETDYIPPEEYDLTMVVEYVQGDSHFAVGLVGGGKQFCFAMNYEHSGWNGLLSVDGKPLDKSGFGVKENLFPKGRAKRTVQIMVRKYGVNVRLDGKDYITFKDDWSRMMTPGGESVANKKNVIFFLVKCTNYYKVHSAVFTFPK